MIRASSGTHQRRFIGVLFAWVVMTVTVLPVIGTPSAYPAMISHEKDKPDSETVTVHFADVPSVVTPKEPLRVTVHLQNHTAEARGPFTVELAVRRNRLNTKSLLTKWSKGNIDGASVVGKVTISSVEPGATVPVTFNANDKDLKFDPSVKQWGPRGLKVQVIESPNDSSRSTTPLDSDRTVTVWHPQVDDGQSPPYKPLKTAVVVPIVGPPASPVTGKPSAASMASLMKPGGRLDRLLTVVERTSAHPLIDPVLLLSVDQPEAGPATNGDTQQSIPATPNQTATTQATPSPTPSSTGVTKTDLKHISAWQERMLTVLRSAGGYALPAGDVDTVSWASSGTQVQPPIYSEVLRRSWRQSRHIMTTLRLDDVHVLGFPANGQLNGLSVLAMTDAARTGSDAPTHFPIFIASDTSAPSSRSSVTSNGVMKVKVPVPSKSGLPEPTPDPHALVMNSDLSSMFGNSYLPNDQATPSATPTPPQSPSGNPSTPATSEVVNERPQNTDSGSYASELAAQAAAITLERPSEQRYLVAVTGRQWDVDIEAGVKQINALTGQQWATRTTLKDVAESELPRRRDKEFVVMKDAKRPLLPEAGVSTAARAADTLLFTARALSDPAPEIERAHNSLRAALATEWRADQDAWNEAISALEHRAQWSRDAVRIQPGSRVNVVAADVELPITVVNDRGYPVSVALRVKPVNGRITVKGPLETVRVEPNSTTLVRLPMRAIANGDVTTTAELLNTNGDVMGDPSKISIRIRREWESRGSIAVLAIVAALLAAGVVRGIRRDRRHRHTMAPAKQN